MVPPEYTEDTQSGENPSNYETLQQSKQPPNGTDPDRPDPEDLVLVGLKGMIPLTMNPEAGASGETTSGQRTAAYSIDNDPLLQDNVDPDHQAFVGFLQKKSLKFYADYKDIIWKIITVIMLAGYTIYLGFGIAYSPYGAIAPCVFTGFGILFWAYYAIKRRWGKQINRKVLRPIDKWWNRNWDTLKWFVYPTPLLAVIIVLSITITEVKQLQSLSGFIFFFFLMWITSKHPDKVVWRPVIWGYSLQFVMGMMVLQWEYGYTAVEWLSQYVAKIINFGYHGAAIIYGDPFMVLHPYVMMGMSLLIYVGAMMSILYYLGLTQLVASKMAWAMSVCFGTTAIETLGVVSNIMLNGMDVIMMLRPYVMKLTISEFNCFMVGNNATIAGFMFGLLILFGAPPQHLLTAAVMSSPAAMAIAKLNWPETIPERSLTRNIKEVRLSKGTEKNMVEAAANGSAIAGRTAFTVVVNYISFMSMLAFIDASLSWIGERVGYPQVSFGWICSYLFYPIPLLIGVEISQCREVAKVIGLKVFTTEVYAYQVLGQLYDQGVIDERSKALGTYALCGFCSLSTLAIAVGIWAVIYPPRRALVSKLMIRVMFEANVACFTTACIAGLFYSDKLQVFDSADSTPGQKLIKWLYSRIPKLLS